MRLSISEFVPVCHAQGAGRGSALGEPRCASGGREEGGEGDGGGGGIP